MMTLRSTMSTQLTTNHRGITASKARLPYPSSKKEEFQFDPWLIWVAFRKHWYWCFPVGCALAAAVAGYLWSGFVPVYRSSHLLETNQDYLAFRGFSENSAKIIVADEVRLLKDGTVLGPVLSDPEITKFPELSNPLTAERVLAKRLSMSSSGNKFIVVSYTSPDPQAAAAICNAVVKSYQDHRQTATRKRIARSRKHVGRP